MKKEMISTGYPCHQCKEEILKEKDGISTGYGTDRNGNKTCFKCCGLNDAKELEGMKIGERSMLYLCKDEKGYKLTNWPSSLEIRINHVRKGYHNWAGKRYDLWFNFKGNDFWGVQYGDNTQICHIKRIKNT